MALQNLRSSTAHKRPTPASMSDGQIALNTNATDTGLFFKDASGNLVKAGPVSVGTSAPNSSAAGSSGNSVGEIWLDTTSSNYIVKVWDGTAWRFDAGLAYLAGLSFTNESTFKTAVNLETGVDVQAYDAGLNYFAGLSFSTESTFKSAVNLEPGVDVQAYDAGLNYLAGLTFNTESTFKQAVNLEIGVDVQAYDADTAKTDVAQTFSAAQTFTPQSVHNGGVKLDGPYEQVAEAVSALDIDLNNGNYFTKTINGNSTFTFSNPPSSGTVGSFTLELTHTSGTVTWPSSVKFNGDTAPTLTTGKTHLFFFVTDDGGTRYRGAALVDYVN